MNFAENLKSERQRLGLNDGKSDFVMLRIDTDGCWMILTSSAKYSADFARRVGFEGPHDHCKRVEDHFPNVNAIKLNK